MLSSTRLKSFRLYGDDWDETRDRGRGDGRRRPRVLYIFGALMLAGLTLVAAGCALDAQILVRFSGAAPTVVTESIRPEQTPERVYGVTRRNRQVIRVNCAVTLLYDVKEATGSTVLAQRYVVKLRTRPVRRGIAYRLDCMGPVIVELPVDASVLGATASSASGAQTALPIQTTLTSLPLAHGKRLRADPDTRFALVDWQPTLPSGDYELQLTLSFPDANAVREKAVYTASVSCGGARYLQPILPPVTKMARAPAFTIRRSADVVMVALPRVASGTSSYAEAERLVSCAP